jgi:hypothetical protein
LTFAIERSSLMAAFESTTEIILRKRLPSAMYLQ